MVDDEAGIERGLIRSVDEHITDRYGVVVDDVVLRTWGNEQIELTYLLLSAAISASGAEVDEADLWLVARAVAFPGATPRNAAVLTRAPVVRSA
ncbi:hypothetical protein [uncultured Amnibacterium sp.]|uniref:hypothetical protein n=1 Tax=uncultured Amnibacterium sp. TaxID=1631851 RepID=UPI0035CA3B93